MKEKILLTGSSGTVGKEVLDQLLEKDDYDITIFSSNRSRNRRKNTAFNGRIKVIYGNISILKEVERLNDSFETVIHLAGVIPPLTDENPDLAHEVNTKGTAHLIQVLEKTSPNAFFMYSSSIAVYGDRLVNPYIKVGDALDPSAYDAYALTKIKTEEFIRNTKLDWTIFRLSAVMGNNNPKISKLMFRMPLETSIEIITPKDTARAFVNGIEKKEFLSKQIFNVAGGKKCRISYRDLLKKSFKLYGLGELNFPPKAFAEKNFHCGIFEDGDDLERIVNFRKEDLSDYFKMVEKSIPAVQKIATQLFKSPIKYFLQRQSEPLTALKVNNKEQIERFFN